MTNKKIDYGTDILKVKVWQDGKLVYKSRNKKKKVKKELEEYFETK